LYAPDQTSPRSACLIRPACRNQIAGETLTRSFRCHSNKEIFAAHKDKIAAVIIRLRPIRPAAGCDAAAGGFITAVRDMKCNGALLVMVMTGFRLARD